MSSLDCFSPLILCHPILQGVKLFKRPTYQHRPVNFVTVSWGATMRQLILSSGCRGDDHQPWEGAVFKDRLVTDSLLLFHIYKINIYIYMLLFHCSICDIHTMFFFLFMFLCMYHWDIIEMKKQCEYELLNKFLPVCWQCIHTCQLLIIATELLGFPPLKMFSLVACFLMFSWLYNVTYRHGYC